MNWHKPNTILLTVIFATELNVRMIIWLLHQGSVWFNWMFCSDVGPTVWSWLGAMKTTELAQHCWMILILFFFSSLFSFFWAIPPEILFSLYFYQHDGKFSSSSLWCCSDGLIIIIIVAHCSCSLIHMRRCIPQVLAILYRLCCWVYDLDGNCRGLTRCIQGNETLWVKLYYCLSPSCRGKIN